MVRLPERRKVRDVELMTALAHPLRAGLLRYLMAVGPRTASECAEAVGSTASNCSWHLRQLAKFGLVEAEPDAGDARQRPWKASVVGLELGSVADDPAMRAAQLAVFGASLADEQELTQRFLDRTDELGPEWRDAGGVNTYALRITAAELGELAQQIEDLVRPYVATIRTDAPPGARPVHAGFRAFPRLERGQPR
ncbi:helix-turn-helix domain-containing protein [Actinophytocola sp.]|uniref:helix-turn-helix domain-containing protein n=1 Tax=Actinophytocola sp. TaxID=1872138 RepID=UPI002EDB27B0